MEKVIGIGGLFFRARDAASLARWYQDHLGVAVTPSNYDEEPWRQEAGPTAFAPFPDDTAYFGDAAKVWMVNFRVRHLEAMVANCAPPASALRLTRNYTRTAASPACTTPKAIPSSYGNLPAATRLPALESE
jgi:glyoxylase I family protein